MLVIVLMLYSEDVYQVALELNGWVGDLLAATEAAASLDVLVSRKLTTQTQVVPAKEQLVQIVNMLIGLLKGLGYDFESRTACVHEEADSSFTFEQEQEQEKE